MAPKIPRDERIHVLLTKSERGWIQAAADEAGLGISTFIRVKTLEALDGTAEKPKPQR